MTTKGKFIFRMLIVILVIATVVFLSLVGKRQADKNNDVDTNTQQATTTPAAPEMPAVSKLDTATILIPDTSNSTKLSNGKGRFVDEGTPFFTEVRLSEQKIVARVDDNSYYVAPFGVDSGGTGYFMYLGLFTAGTPSSPQHIDSEFLGDRIVIKSLRQGFDGAIELDLLMRPDDAPMAAEPTELHTYRYIIQNNSLVKLGSVE